jgi:hypothetical protein
VEKGTPDITVAGGSEEKFRAVDFAPIVSTVNVCAVVVLS